MYSLTHITQEVIPANKMSPESLSLEDIQILDKPE